MINNTENSLLKEADELIAEELKKVLKESQSPTDLLSLITNIMKKRESTQDTIKSAKKTPLITFKFIKELSENYFKELPPKKPTLLEFIDECGKKSPFLHKEITAMLISEGGRGKTRLVVLLACCIALGIPFLDTYEVTQRGATALILGENNHDDIRRLLYDTAKYLLEKAKTNLDLKNRKFTVYSEDIKDYENFITDSILPISVQGQDASFLDKNGQKTEFFECLLKGLKDKEPEEGWQLICLDPASRFMGLEAEKDNALATRFMALLEELSASLKNNPTILLAHHANKTGVKDGEATTQLARGASGTTDASRWVSILRKDKEADENISILEITKTNFTAYQKPIKIKFNNYRVPEFDSWVNSKKNPNEKINNAKDNYDQYRS